jgi:hypothetical protein
VDVATSAQDSAVFHDVELAAGRVRGSGLGHSDQTGAAGSADDNGLGFLTNNARDPFNVVRNVDLRGRLVVVHELGPEVESVRRLDVVAGVELAPRVREHGLFLPTSDGSHMCLRQTAALSSPVERNPVPPVRPLTFIDARVGVLQLENHGFSFLVTSEERI